MPKIRHSKSLRDILSNGTIDLNFYRFVMKNLNYFYIFLSIAYLFNVAPFAYGMQKDDLPDIGALTINDVYYSDSEDEEGYTYQGLPAFDFNHKRAKDCIPLMRGIHFTPSKFDREQISQLRRENDSRKAICSSAAYDLAGVPLGQDSDEVLEYAGEIRDQVIELSEEERNTFQQIYSNQYDKFHHCLGTNAEGGIFAQFESSKNPQVSTAENFFHATKYAGGLKYLGGDVHSLDPEYDAEGKPKHPYLGKVTVILADEDEIDDHLPYFVVHGHANDAITISSHYSKNILEEREVSFPGFVPADAVVVSLPVRVPSFKGEYKPYYQQKYGLSKRMYTIRKKILIEGKYFKGEKADPQAVKKKTVHSLLNKVILPHRAKQIQEHLQAQCQANNIHLVHKQLDGTFGDRLPSLVNAQDLKRRIKH